MQCYAEASASHSGAKRKNKTEAERRVINVDKFPREIYLAVHRQQPRTDLLRMIVELALLTQLARACAPQVAVETLAAVARTESGFDALAIHDNTSGRSYRPATQAEAAALANRLVIVQGHSVDLGLMQINSVNLPRLGLAPAEAFDPCRSLEAAQRLLTGSYTAPSMAGSEQAALDQALSRYNTGHSTRGIANGYVQRVRASAEIVVPALQVRGTAKRADAAVPEKQDEPTVVQAAAPQWDVYGQARVAWEQNKNTPRPQPSAPGPDSASGLTMAAASTARLGSPAQPATLRTPR